MELPIYLLDLSILSAQSLTSSFNSSSTEIKEAARLCYEINWSGTTPVGTFNIQGSNDNVNFANDPESSASGSVSGNSGNLLLKVANPAYAYVRLSYTSTSGSGTTNALLSAKRG